MDPEADESESLGAPDPAVYKGHSRGIIETLEGLLEEAKDNLDTARKTETKNIYEYEMLKQALADEIKFAEEDLAKAKAAAGEGGLAVTSKDLAADVKDLADLHELCMTKAKEFG